MLLRAAPIMLLTRKGKDLSDTVLEALILDLVEWVADGERSYEAVMDAWRTSCPRLPVWEEANDRGLVTIEQADGRLVVKASASAFELLARYRASRP